MILPKGNSKKYIKTVIGVYILYVIISPVITTVSGHELKLDYDIYDKYFTISDEYKSIQKDFESKNNKYIESTYKEEIRKQIKKTINELNYFRVKFNETKNKLYWRQMIEKLPSSYNQRRTLTMNYENVVTIIKQRTGHKLDEWNEFVKVLRDLPYIQEITGYDV